MGAGAGYAAACVLGGIFLVAGAAKILDPRPARRAFADLGLPAAGLLTRLVPLFEIAIASGMMLMPRAAAVVALVALAAFTGVIAPHVGRGVGCGCFGAVSRHALSFVELVRNAMLAALAVAALAAPAPTVPRLEDVLVVGAAWVTGLVVLALCAMRRDVGAVWDTTLAGEL